MISSSSSNRSSKDRVNSQYILKNKVFLKKLKMKKAQSSLIKFIFCLNIICTCSVNVAHSEYIDIAK